MGLYIGKVYTDVDDLRYGSIMIMTDQDHDGSHIKGLIINFIHHFWPSLLKIKGFLKEFITPIIKAAKGLEVKSFFTLADYEKWQESTRDSKSWKIKYYKGLGTSTLAEAKEYFKAINDHVIYFRHAMNSGEDDAINLAFSKDLADRRKTWLSTYNHRDVIDHTHKQMCFEEFINRELIHFSVADNTRSIPSMVDGLKPG
jgi:DNA topoisomerase II